MGGDQKLLILLLWPYRYLFNSSGCSEDSVSVLWFATFILLTIIVYLQTYKWLSQLDTMHVHAQRHIWCMSQIEPLPLALHAVSLLCTQSLDCMHRRGHCTCSLLILKIAAPWTPLERWTGECWLVVPPQIHSISQYISSLVSRTLTPWWLPTIKWCLNQQKRWWKQASCETASYHQPFI